MLNFSPQYLAAKIGSCRAAFSPLRLASLRASLSALCAACSIVIVLGAGTAKPQVPDIDLDRSEQFLLGGDYSEARSQFRAFCQVDNVDRRPDRARAYSGWAIAEAQLGNPSRSAALFDQAVREANSSRFRDTDTEFKSRYHRALIEISRMNLDPSAGVFLLSQEVQSSNLNSDQIRSALFAEEQLIRVETQSRNEGDIRTFARARLARSLLSLWSVGKNEEAQLNGGGVEEALSALFDLAEGSRDGSFRIDDIDLALDLVEASVASKHLQGRLDAGDFAFEHLWIEHILAAARRDDFGEYEARALGARGRILAVSGQFEEAKSEVAKALLISQQKAQPQHSFFLFASLADLHLLQLQRDPEARSDLEARRDLKEKALLAFDAARENYILAGAYFRQPRRPLDPFFEQLAADRILTIHVETILNSGASSVNFENVLPILSDIRLARIERFLERQCSDTGGVSIGDLAADSAHSERVIILTPIILSDKVVILIQKTGEQQIVTVNAEPNSVRLLLERIKDLLGSRSSSRPELLAELSNFHNLFLKDLRNTELNDIDIIVFEPTGEFRGIPLAAAYDAKAEGSFGATGRFLVEDFEIVTSFGLSVPQRPIVFPEVNGIFASLSEEVAVPPVGNAYPLSSQGVRFRPLRFVEREVEAISSLPAVNAKVLPNFTRKRLEQALSEEEINTIHFATHAVFGAEPDERYLLGRGAETGRGDRIGLQDIRQLVGQAQTSSNSLELVALSACQTGVGDNRANDSDAILGLAGIAIESGARSVLASLWKVDDQSTGQLMVSFYQAWSQRTTNPSTTKSGALREAQLLLIREGHKYPIDYSHPHYWSGFILSGDWR